MGEPAETISPFFTYSFCTTPGPQPVRGAVIGQLGLLDGQLGLLQSGGGAARVDAVEQLPLFHPVAVLEGGLQDLAGDQRSHLIGLNGRYGAGAVHRDGQVLPLDGGGLVLSGGGRWASKEQGAQEQEEDPCRGEDQDQPLEPFFALFGQLEAGGGGEPLWRLRLYRRFRGELCGFHGVDSLLCTDSRALGAGEGGQAGAARPKRCLYLTAGGISFPERKA